MILLDSIKETPRYLAPWSFDLTRERVRDRELNTVRS